MIRNCFVDVFCVFSWKLCLTWMLTRKNLVNATLFGTRQRKRCHISTKFEFEVSYTASCLISNKSRAQDRWTAGKTNGRGSTHNAAS